MIKLERAQKPAYLTDEKCQELTEQFKLENSSVWNHKEIKDPLLKSSNGKCAYCECSITEESKYMEVEHFLYKKSYQDNVVEWSNLLPSCKRCNLKKSKHDAIAEPILNPYIIDPKIHFRVHYYRIKGITDIGKSTVDVLDLNNSDRLVLKRYEIGNAALQIIEDTEDQLKLFKSDLTTRNKNKLLAMVETLLNECQPKSIYAAATGSVIFNNYVFLEIVREAKMLGIWEEDLDNLFKLGKKISFIPLN